MMLKLMTKRRTQMRIKIFTLSIISIVIALTVLLTSSIGFADTEVGGLIDQNTNWTLDKSPYIAIGNLVVKEGVTLTIKPGVTVKFKPSTILGVDGTLIARGTQEMPITFTPSQEKDPGNWGYVLFAGMPSELDSAGNYIQGSILEYVIIEYAGGIDDIDTALKVHASNLLIDHCTISYSATTGVLVDSGGVVIRNSIISDNMGSWWGGGIYIGYNKCTATITNNIITRNDCENDCGGITASTSSTVTISNNVITNNSASGSFSDSSGILVGQYSNVTITNNIIISNNRSNRGPIFIGSTPDQFKGNCIYNNSGKFDIYYDVKNGTDMDATENYWGTTDATEISARIYDFIRNPDKGVVDFVPFLTVPPPSCENPPPPQTPSNKAPADRATDIPLTPTLESSAFSHPEGDSHKASQWQITTSAGNYVNPIYDSGVDTTNKTKIAIPKGKLILNTTYYWHVRYQDNRGNWSDYSKETRFTTLECPPCQECPPTPPGIYQSKLSLTRGINIISLSLKPETPWTAKTIVQQLGATLVIRALDGNFEAYIEGRIGEGFPIEANKGYIVNVRNPVTYTLQGKAWGEPVASPSIEIENPTWAFVVTGVITPNIAEITEVKSLHTGKSITAKINQDGRFIAVFVDLSRHSVVEAGDDIELSFIDQHGNLLSKVIRRIQEEQIEQAYLNTLIELIPAKTVLFQNYPNPFNPETWIPYQIAQDAQVTIEIFNIAGELIHRIELGNQTAGWYMTKDKAAFWNGCNKVGESVASGIYFYKLNAGNYSAVRKMLIVK
jgi:hypothetical protein